MTTIAALIMPRVTLETVLDEYLRRKTKGLKQEDVGELIGTRRQGVNAILSRKEGRRFTWEHLDRYAGNSDMLSSSVLTELANLAFQLEQESIGRHPSAPPPSSSKSGEDPLLELCARLLEELKHRRGR